MSEQANTDTKDTKDDKKNRVFGLVVAPNDGYTLRAVCQSTDTKKPRLTFCYRPALPEAVYEYQEEASKDPKSRLSAVQKLLAAHVVSWDLRIRQPNGEITPLEFRAKLLEDSRVLLCLGVDYLNTMAAYVQGYLAGDWEEDAKN